MLGESDLWGENVGEDWRPHPHAARGVSLGFNRFAQSSPGDFLPPAKDLQASSLCLLPDQDASSPTAWAGLTRPMLNNSVDLITGLPLIQVADLELPMRGATFRLIRTRSGDRTFSEWGKRPDQESDGIGGNPSDDWWDWTGSGWMTSENPLLLIDSTVPDVVGKTGSDEDPARIVLPLDAHRSIPFVRLNDTGQYEAPPDSEQRSPTMAKAGSTARGNGACDRQNSTCLFTTVLSDTPLSLITKTCQRCTTTITLR